MDCQYQNCEAVKNCYAFIVKTLEEEIGNATDEYTNETPSI